MRPLTLMCVFFLLMVSSASVAAVVCHGDESCKREFDAPKQLLCCGCLVVVVVALVMAEMQEGHQGMAG